MANKKSLIIFGPPRCGKSHNSKMLMAKFGFRYLIDGCDLTDYDPPPFDHLILTNTAPPPHLDIKAISFENAMKGIA